MVQALKSVTVFCGSALGNNSLYRDKAAELGQLLAKEGVRLVYGGSFSGLMGVIADSVLQNGGEAVGVIPRHMVERNVHHKGLTELHVVDSMHTRKALMADLADGFIAMPGGFGTLDEFCEIVTWAQLGLHKKPMALLNPGSFWDGFIRFYEHATEEGYIAANQSCAILHDESPAPLLEKMKSWQGMPQKEAAKLG